MCGICGELRFDATSPDMAMIERMSEKLARRGPDHAGTFSDGPLAFGHRRLAIIDLSATADQPMVDSTCKQPWCSTARSTTTGNCAPN